MRFRDPIARARFARNLWFTLLAWPLLTVFAATLEARRLPYYSLSWLQAIGSAFGGTLLLTPDFLVVGLVFATLSTFVFGRFAPAWTPGSRPPHRGEPILLFLAMNAGIALWYPGVLGISIVSLPHWPAWSTIAALVLLVVAGSFAVAPARGGRLAAALLLVGVLTPLPAIGRARLAGTSGATTSIVMLGLDSLSLEDDVRPLREWVRADGGTWYEKAVTPGLLTNAVWSSILTQTPVSAHGVFHPNQHLTPAQATLLRVADARGFATISYFFDQLTCTVGSEAGFTDDRSGPMGWRQLLLPLIANSSILIPAIRPALPDGWSALRANQAGAYSYDLERSLREAMRAGRDGQPTLVMAHSTYLHSPIYPSTLDLGLDELTRVWQADASVLRDRSFDWQDRDRPSDPVALRAWKTRRLQEAIARSARDTGLLGRGGTLIVFSDHGLRDAVTYETFVETRYHHVVLATFGVAARAAGEPISLIDVGALAGLTPDAPPAAPVVEFAVTPNAYWAQLVRTAGIRWNGSIDLDQRILDAAFANLKRHHPWPVPTSLHNTTHTAWRPAGSPTDTSDTASSSPPRAPSADSPASPAGTPRTPR